MNGKDFATISLYEKPGDSRRMFEIGIVDGNQFSPLVRIFKENGKVNISGECGSCVIDKDNAEVISDLFRKAADTIDGLAAFGLGI